MADVHRRAAASAPRLTPDEVATRGFASAFRGLSELEVRNFLKRVAEEMTTTLDRQAALEAQVEELREQLAHPPLVSEERLLDALGEETARVLRSAQESAEDIRKRAQADAETQLGEAGTEATRIREEADADAAAMRDAAQTAAATLEDEAQRYAIELRETADSETAALRATTDEDLRAQREAAEAAAESEVEAAKSAGRDLVNEARSVRERILADLGRRRMLLQAQIDELRAGRDRLLDAYRIVKRTLGDATDALVQVEARAAAELAGPAPMLEDVEPVAGEAAALAGELTGESGPVSADVEALFARLRAQSAGPADEVGAAPGAPDAEVESEALPPPGLPPAPEAETAPVPEVETAPVPEVETAPEPRSPSDAEPTPAPVVDEPLATSEGDHGASEPAEAPDATTGTWSGEVTDDEARAARGVVLEPLRRELGRKVKRALQDEQNDVLDRIRTVKGAPAAVDLLPPEAEQVASLVATMRAPVDAAYRGGRVAAGATGSSPAAPAPMVDGLAAAMVARLRERIVEAIDGTPDQDAVTQRLGSRYREFKGRELDAVVGDTLAAAFALGVFDGAPTGQMLRWVPDSVGECPDCDDNALEPTVKGKVFPTGQPHPPAHPGCRCLLVPVW